MNPGTLVGDRYRIERKLGQGGMSAVYVATDTKFQQRCAIKIAWPHGLSHEDFRARFQREAMIGRLLGQVGRGFVRIVDWGDWQADALYLVMDLVEDATDLDLVTGSRAERLERYARAARLVRDAHNNGVIHRDLKPANFLLQPKDGAVFLTDFGLAKLLGTDDEDDSQKHMGHLTQSGLTMGTPWYMAPEQFDAKHADERADVYSLGVMLFQALTGEIPFKCGLSELASRHEAMRNGQLAVPSPRKLDPSVPEGLDAICSRSLAMAPERRTPDAQSILDVVEPWLRTQQPAAPAPLAPRASGRHQALEPAKPVPAGVNTQANAATCPPEANPEGGPSDPGPPAPPGLRRVEGKAALYESERDGGLLVWVPPGRYFPRLRTAADGDGTLTQVEVPGLFVGRTAVTWGQYARFCAATSRPAPRPGFPVDDEHPVHGVTWEEAKAFCAWAGGRLPSEVEWEHAASGEEERVYPWGDEPPTATRANYACEGSPGRTTPVGRYPAGASPFGLLDLGGNVLEWVDDPRPKAATRPLRGGSWRLDASFLVIRRKHLLAATAREPHVGFRLVRDADGASSDLAPAQTMAEVREPPAPRPPAAPPRKGPPAGPGGSGRGVPMNEGTDPRPLSPRASGKRPAVPGGAALLDQVLALLPAQAREPARRGEEIKLFWGDERVPLSILPGDGPGPAHVLIEQRVKLDRAALRGTPTGLDNLLRAANAITSAALGVRLVVGEDRLRYRRAVLTRGAPSIEAPGPPVDREQFAAHLERVIDGWHAAAEPVRKILKGELWSSAMAEVEGATPDLDRVDLSALPDGWTHRPGATAHEVWPEGADDTGPPLELSWRGELEATVLVRPGPIAPDALRAWTAGAAVPAVDATLRALNDRQATRPWTLSLEADRGVVARLFLGTLPVRSERLYLSLSLFHAAVLRDALPST